MTRLGMLILILIAMMTACGGENQGNTGSTPPIPYKLKMRWKHDPTAWTQGLLIHNGQLYESTGQKNSWVGIIDIKTGKPDKKVVLDEKYFGEGITILNNKLYQLTWKDQTGFVYDLNTFEKIREFTYSTEGWGLTHDGANLIMSNGTEKLIYLDTATLETVKTVAVWDENGPVTRLNELEFMEGFVLANQWETNHVLKIDPSDGRVVGYLDLTPLVRDAKMENPGADVLNGIAYHPTTKLLIITGKFWSSCYVLQLNQSNDEQ